MHTLKSLRIKSGKTLEQMGTVFGYSRQAIERWEKNKSKPNAKCCAILAEEYGVTTDEIISIIFP